MAIFAIADLHLSLGTDKPMDVFAGWDGYLPRLEQKIHPRVPRVPSRLGQVKPPSKDSLYTLQPKTSRQY